MNPVWSITLAEKHPLPPITLHYAAPDEESARTGIQKWYPGREIVSVLPNNKNPNSNCLDGFECPACGSYGPFYIRATVTGETLVSDDGTEGVMGDVEWDDNSACRCADCGHPGTVREFMGKPAPEFDAFQQIVANTYDNGEHECHTPDDIDTCGDSLLMFLMRELSLSEDCDSIEEAISRVDVAIRQLEAVRDGLEVASIDRAHLLSNWRVSLYDDKNDRTATILFECQAENGAHAAEQAENAYPNGKVVSIEIIQEASK